VSGRFLRGFRSIAAIKKDIITKNIPPVKTKPIKEPNMAIIIGASMENEVVPVGVVLR
jgi:hypothetical protein